jgi:hypothetical protein
MMNRGNRLRRAALVLALVVLAAVVTGVAASAATTTIPKQMARRWQRDISVEQGQTRMVVSRRGRVEIDQICSSYAPATCTSYDGHAEFSHVTAHRLRISGIPSCSGTGTYRWTSTLSDGFGFSRVPHLRLTKIHDACKARVNLFAHNDWWRY